MPLLSAHCDLQRPPHSAIEGKLTVAQSDLEDCEQELHKHCGGVRPDDLSFFSRRRRRAIGGRRSC